jgi:predicted ATPase
LVSLVGLGGSGKTRLAVKTGHDLLPAFPGGVFLISAPMDETKGRLDTAIAEAVKTRRARGDRDQLATQLIRDLRSQETLLILDGMERVPGQIPFVLDLLEGAPRLRVLATSREPLRVGVETLFPLHGLPTPAPEESPDDIAVYDAIQLLRVLARRFDPGFDPSEEDLMAWAAWRGCSTDSLSAWSSPQPGAGLSTGVRSPTGSRRTSIS